VLLHHGTEPGRVRAALRLRRSAGAIEVEDLQEVNRHLEADAQAKLDVTAEEREDAGD
jgi:hypothetical protein